LVEVINKGSIMDIEILDFIPDCKGMKVGFVDFKVIHSPDKWEIFRNVSMFEKENKKWLSVGSCQRNEKWIPRYEREPNLKNIYAAALKVLDTYLNKLADSDKKKEESSSYWS